jgi:hypothetical protein
MIPNSLFSFLSIIIVQIFKQEFQEYLVSILVLREAVLQFLAKEKPFNFHICVDKHKNDQNYQMPASIVFHVWLKFLIPIIFISFYIFSSLVFYCFNPCFAGSCFAVGFQKVLFYFCLQNRAI